MTSPLTIFFDLLLLESAAIAAAAPHIGENQVSRCIELLLSCSIRRGKLVVTGVGKSGIVARKIAATFSSVGLMAIYMNPLDALHGDLGVVSGDDVILMLSNSGETQELLQLVPHLQLRGSPIISIVGSLASTLARQSTVVFDGSVEREVCPLNLAPTASTAVAMAIGDALAAVWMDRRGISPQDFALNHPAGSLGKQLTLTAASLMVPTSQMQALLPRTPLAEIITALTANGIGACWVTGADDSQQLLGLITDGDLRRALEHHPPAEWADIAAQNMMTTNPVTISPSCLAIKALELMERNPRKSINLLPVVGDNQRMLGLLRLHDLVKAGLT